MKFDDNQISVIKADSGPLLVTAGPGSGKTAVLTHRILYLHEQLKIPYERILVITFTKAAAVQMKSRFEKLLESDSKVTFCTFHSLFYSIIKDFKSVNFQIISLNEKLNILKTVLLFNKTDPEILDLQLILDEFSKYKNTEESLGEFLPLSLDKNTFFKIFKDYNDEVFSRDYLDYDDFSLYVEKFFDSDEDFFKKWRNKYSYCLIDEFQDINYKQYNLIKRMFAGKSVFAVGDEDQSIYAFRGSSSDICLKFKKDFDADVIKLVNNYRSKKKIVEAGMNLISFNTLRFDKKIVSRNANGSGEFELSKFSSYLDEYDSMAKEIKAGSEKNKSQVILLRTNFLSESLRYALLKNKVNANLEKKSENIKNKPYIEDILAYFKIACDDRRYENLIRIANKPNRYLSRSFLSECKINEKKGKEYSYVNLYKCAGDKTYLKANIFKMERQLKELKKLDSFEGLIYIMNVIGFDKYLFEKGVNFKADFEELKCIAREFKYKEDFIDYFDLINDTGGRQSPTDSKGCDICTIHSSKGREWDEVYIPDLNEGNIPHKKAFLKEDIEEERRLFYVAMTRAKDKLWIGFVEDDKRNVKPSIFAKELSTKTKHLKN